MSAFLGVPMDTAYHLVFGLATVLSPLCGSLAAAAAIVLFTLAVRLILVPLSYRAMKGIDTQAKMAPQVQALRQQHSGQPEAFQRALAALYRAEGTSVYAWLPARALAMALLQRHVPGIQIAAHRRHPQCAAQP